MNRNTMIRFFPCLLLIYYGGMAAQQFQGNSWNFEIFLFVALSIAAVALLFKKEWGRKLIVLASVISVADVFMNFFIWRTGFSSMAFIFLAVSVGIPLFYRTSRIKKFYQKDCKGSLKTILVVDDDKVLLKLLSKNLGGEGFFVITAETGEKGLRLARQGKPDLIILDVILPGIKGRSVCSKLKEDPLTRNIPVIFLTAKNSPDDIAAEMAVGGAAHITKPVNFSVLHKEIQKILST